MVNETYKLEIPADVISNADGSKQNGVITGTFYTSVAARDAQ